jgi:hypothetical protein
MDWRRHAALVFAALILMACGPRVGPSAQTSPTASPTPTQQSDLTPTPQEPTPTPPQPTPTPTLTPTQDGITASVTCSGGSGAAMTVVAGAFVYDVSDSVHPRLVCRSVNTVIHLLDGNAIAYTAVVAGHVVIVRRDLTTGAESRIAQLRVAPHPYYFGSPGWTWDGSLEVYSTSAAPRADLRSLVSVHLWSNGADHVLYTILAGPGGLESRWAPRPVLTFSPDRAYLAISDFPFSIYGSNVRIFAVADRRQRFVTGGSSSGGSWIANDRFVWANMSWSLRQWTPTGDAKVLRSEQWWGPNSSSDGRWLAGTLLTGKGPRVLIAPVGGGTTFTTGLGSGPGFVTPKVVWYAEEVLPPPGGNGDPTLPNGTVRAFNVTNGSNQVVIFRVGEAPMGDCCAPRG